jgi:hypothetical protein
MVFECFPKHSITPLLPLPETLFCFILYSLSSLFLDFWTRSPLFCGICSFQAAHHQHVKWFFLQVTPQQA